MPEEPVDHELDDLGSGLLIGNEFARVRLEVVPGPRGDHLRIASIRTGWRRTVPPAAVEALSRLPIDTYLDALETPFGPEPDLAAVRRHEKGEHEPAETDLGRTGRDRPR